MKGGGLVYLLTSKVLSFIGVTILIFMGLVGIVGPKPAASLAGTTATIGGQSTGIVFASLPEFFGSVRDGQALVKKPDCASIKDCVEAKGEKQ